MTTGTGANVGLGYQAGNAITTGPYNIAIGYRAMYATSGTVTGGNNIALGQSTLNSVTSGGDNFGALLSAGTNITTGNNNVTLGREAGESITTGSDNIAIGYQSGDSISTGLYNITLGNKRRCCYYRWSF